MGHLTTIMNEIVNAKDRGPNHDHIMSMFNGKAFSVELNTHNFWQETVKCSRWALHTDRDISKSLLCYKSVDSGHFEQREQ